MTMTPLQRRVRAHSAVWKAIREGTLTRPAKCSRCGSNRNVEAHHPNHDEVLNIEWLCRDCHRKTHASIKFAVGPCERCGQPFSAVSWTRGRKRFCSDTCRMAAWYERNRR